jgi:hypothetical protein
MKWRLTAFFALLVLLAPASPAQVGVGARSAVEIVEHGEYEPGPEAGKQRAPDTSRGYVGVIEATHDPRLLRSTEAIAAGIGGQFGIKLLVQGPPSVETVPLRIRVLHPPFRNPATGELSDREEWDAEVNLGIPRFAGWSFDEPWEIAPGPWQIQVLDGEEVVAEQGFEIAAAEPSEAGGGHAEWRPGDVLERIPGELWERASLIVTGRYGEGRSPCIWVGEDLRVWVRMTGFSVTGRYLGELRSDYVGVNLTAPPDTPYVCAECLVPEREYLLLLRPSPDSMKFLGTPAEAYLWYNEIEGEEILAIVEIPEGLPIEIGERRR